MNTDSLLESGRINRMAQVDEMLNNAETLTHKITNIQPIQTGKYKSIVTITLKNSLTLLYFLFSYCDQITIKT